jgi:hypothetical protein
MEKEKAIELITGRIKDEHHKHSYQKDWPEIAARKIYSQWSEYFQNEKDEKEIVENILQQIRSILKVPEKESIIDYAKKYHSIISEQKAKIAELEKEVQIKQTAIDALLDHEF